MAIFVFLLEEQANEGFSLDNQINDIEKHCAYKEYELLDIFRDDGKSGASILKRDGLISMMRYIYENKVDYLIIYKLSRLSRKFDDLHDITKKLKENETTLVSI